MVHHGSMGGGHYIAYAKHYDKNGTPCWFYFSDSSVRKVTEKEALKAQAYMVFYERRE